MLDAGDAGQPERQADADAAARHVVVEVAVVALEPVVDVGRHRGEQELDVELVEAEPGGERRAGAAPRLAPSAASACASTAARLLGGHVVGHPDPVVAQQLVDPVVAEVQPEERVVGRGVDGPPGGDDARRRGGGARRAGRGVVAATASLHASATGIHGSGPDAAARSGPRPATVAAAAPVGGDPATRSSGIGRPPCVSPTSVRRSTIVSSGSRGDRRAGLGEPLGQQRGDEAHVERRLELAAERRPDIRQRAVLRRRQGDGQRDAEAELGERPVEQLGRHHLVLAGTSTISADSRRCSSSARCVHAVTR